MSSVAASPGQPMVVGVPIGVRHGSVVLESASLVPLGSYPLPHMVGVGVKAGNGYVTSSLDWLANEPAVSIKVPPATASPLAAALSGDPAAIRETHEPR